MKSNEIKMKAIKDGDKWAFVLFDFENLQTSPSVWINEPMLNDILDEAFTNLVRQRTPMPKLPEWDWR